MARACLLALLSAAVAAATSACGSSRRSASAVTGRAGAPLESILEAEAQTHADPAAALATLRRLGVERVRVYVPWDAVAPDPTAPVPPSFDAGDPAAYPAAAWAPYDAIIRAAHAVRIGIDLTVGPPAPVWAAGSGAPAGSAYRDAWRPSAAAFGAFVHALGRRYDGRYEPAGAGAPLPRVDFWALWNEPNYGHYLAPQAIDGGTVEVAPALYRSLLGAAWSALAATGHRPATDTILIGETAPRGLGGPGLPGAFDGMVPLRFIRALYCIDGALEPLRGSAAAARGCPATSGARARFASENPALFEATGFADHPYPDALAPNVRTPPPVGTDYADFAARRDLERTLDGATGAYALHRHLPIYSTEFGYRTDPPNSQLGLPLATAARYLNEAEYLSWRDPRIRSYDQYLLTDPPSGSRSAFVTGIEFADGRPKPDVFDAYEMPLYLPSPRAGSGVEAWGCARPAPQQAARTRRPQTVAIQFEPARASSFRTLRTVAIGPHSCYFDVRIDLPGAGLLRTVWQRANRRLVSRTEVVKAR